MDINNILKLLNATKKLTFPKDFFHHNRYDEKYYNMDIDDILKLLNVTKIYKEEKDHWGSQAYAQTGTTYSYIVEDPYEEHLVSLRVSFVSTRDHDSELIISKDCFVNDKFIIDLIKKNGFTESISLIPPDFQMATIFEQDKYNVELVNIKDGDYYKLLIDDDDSDSNRAVVLLQKIGSDQIWQLSLKNYWDWVDNNKSLSIKEDEDCDNKEYILQNKYVLTKEYNENNLKYYDEYLDEKVKNIYKDVVWFS